MSKKISVRKKFEGFTLLELVIVIAIISILIGIAVPKYNKSRKNAEIAAHNANVRAVQNAAVLYLSENPDVSEVSSEQLTKYFADGKVPKPLIPKGENFVVKINGDTIVVNPGLVEKNEKEQSDSK